MVDIDSNYTIPFQVHFGTKHWRRHVAFSIITIVISLALTTSSVVLVIEL